jgi:hypothetical protein
MLKKFSAKVSSMVSILLAAGTLKFSQKV